MADFGIDERAADLALSLDRLEDPMERSYTLHVVTHSHLDREWYASFQYFRLRLVRLFDRVLDLLDQEPEVFRSFHADGQTQVLADYLEVRPERRERLEKHIREGRFVVGPWCVLPDEFLVSGEAHLRNLLRGRHMALAAGSDPATHVGYLPDMFGHFSQVPQILAGFELGHAVLWRGLSKPDLPAELWWESPDGTRIRAFHLPGPGYSNCPIPADVSVEEAVNILARARDEEARRTSTSHLLLMNGTDHAVPRPDIAEVLRRFAARFPQDRVVHGTLAGFLAASAAETDWGSAPVVRGELRDTNWEPGGHYNFVLPNVLSSRVYLKQADHDVCARLVSWAEPSAAMLRALLGDDSMTEPVRAAWAQVILNHPHDSIGGCSIDAVHRQMETRFEEAGELADAAAGTAQLLLARSVDTGWTPEGAAPVVLFTASPSARADVLEGTLALPRSLAQAQLGLGDADPLPPDAALRLWDSAGREIPVQTLGLRREDRFEIADLTTWAPHRAVVACDIALSANGLPPLGFASVAAGLTAYSPAQPEPNPRVLENEHLSVTIEGDGTLTLTEKATGRRYTGLGFLEDGGDSGDGYTYSPPVGGDTVLETRGSTAVTVESLQSGPLLESRRVTRRWELPAGLAETRKERDTGQKVACELVMDVTLKAGSRRVEVTTRFDNRARDHRLRAVFPAGFPAAAWLTDSQFDIVERPVEVPQPPEEVWIEDQPRQMPLQSWAAARREDGSGLAVATRGLKECEATTEQDGNLALHLTLLRAVAWLGAPGDQVSTIVAGAGPGLPTPDSQCLRPLTFEYAILPFESIEGLLEEAAAYANPALRAVTLVRRPAEAPQLPPSGSFLTLLGPEDAPGAAPGVVLSAVKPSEQGGGVVVRLYNPTDEVRQARLRFLVPPTSLVPARLDETPDRPPLALEDDTATVTLAPRRILTLLAMLR